MVDRNNNGIPDDRERVAAVKRAQPVSPTGGRRLAVSNDPNPVVQGGGQNPFEALSRGIGGAIGNLGALSASRQAPTTQVAPRSAPQGQLWKMGKGPQGASGMAAEPEKSFADYLAEAMGMIGQGGAGGGGGVNYDPQRNTLKQNAGENDARLEAMYRQLRGSIDADAPVIQQAYQEAIDNTANTTQTAVDQTQAATDSAQAQQNQIMQNLGIQQAQGNQIQQGVDLGTQQAQNIADQASTGQAAGTRLASNQATALSHNTNIGNAAGLEGNLQRAGNQSRLQALLAEIDMQEQQQNASLSASSGNDFSSQLSLAQQLMGFDQDKQARQDEQQYAAAELASKGQQKTLPDLGAYLQALGINPADIAKEPGKYGSLLSSLTKFGVQQ